MIKKKSNLNKIEGKYCRCLVKVRGKSKYLHKNKIINPYGICTKSVYILKGKKRTKKVSCLKNLNLNKLSFNKLKAYAIEKKIKVTNLSRTNLINKLKYFKYI